MHNNFIQPFTGPGRWFKGNTHIHSTASDGGKSFDELAAMYRRVGYDFLFRTDHWVCSTTSETAAPDELLWLNGNELDGCDHSGSAYHVICLGTVTDLDRQKLGLVGAMESARRQGAILILAHPLWMGNSLEDATRYAFHGVELYNHVCGGINGKSRSDAHAHAMLARNPSTLLLAADDTHLSHKHPGWNGGWIKIWAPERTRDAILAAIRNGAFYSSCGPDILGLECDGATLHVTTSPVRYIRLVGPSSCSGRPDTHDGTLITSASVRWPTDSNAWAYAFLEIEDADGKRAWTSNLLRREE
jgi:hypothetical protein